MTDKFNEKPRKPPKMAKNRDLSRARKGFLSSHRESHSGSRTAPGVTNWSHCTDFRFLNDFRHATTSSCKFFSTSPQPPRYAACASLAGLKTSPGAALRLGQGAKKSVKVFKARCRRRASILAPSAIRNGITQCFQEPGKRRKHGKTHGVTGHVVAQHVRVANR